MMKWGQGSHQEHLGSDPREVGMGERAIRWLHSWQVDQAQGLVVLGPQGFAQSHGEPQEAVPCGRRVGEDKDAISGPFLAPGRRDKRVVLRACAHRWAVKVEALLQGSGQPVQHLGHLSLQAANQSPPGCPRLLSNPAGPCGGEEAGLGARGGAR